MIASVRRTSRYGFTLVEMLVIVGMILVLAGALYPALLKAQEWGRAAKCMSNLRQLQIATMHFQTDSARLPAAYDFWHQDTLGYWHLVHGWVGGYTWSGYPSEIASGNPGASSYSWRGTQGLQSLTNGSLWAYVQQEKSVYLCPTFAQKAVCKQTDAIRSYSMNSSVHWRYFTDQRLQASRTVLYGEDNGLLAGQMDASYATNSEVGRWHGIKGHVIYIDGHTDRW